MRMFCAFLSASCAISTPASAIPPAMPASGPVAGSFECLVHRASADVASTILVSEGSEEQVFIQGALPINLAEVDSVVLKANAEIALSDRKGVEVLRLKRTARGRNGNWWQMNVRASDGRFMKAGICFGELQQGRADRPIVLKSIRTVSVEAEGVDE